VSGTSRVKTLKHNTMKKTQHNSLVIWFSDARDLGKIVIGSPPAGTPNAGAVGKIAFFDRSRLRRLRRSTAEDLHPSATIVCVDDGALAERYRSVVINNVGSSQVLFIIPRLHDTNRLSNRLSNPFDNRFDNRVERTATVRSTGCQTGLYNRFDDRLYTRYSRLSAG